jgi:uncharacterized membrane protein
VERNLVASVANFLYTPIDKLLKLPKALLVAIVSYIVVISAVSLVKHHFFFTTAWDLGIFNQILYFSLHGKVFQYNLEPWFTNSLPTNFLAVHVSPILLALLPVYAIAPRPETLLVLQPVIVALAAIPLFLIAKEELENEKLALMVAFTYVFHPGIIGGNLFDFHLEAFIPLTTFSTIYFLRKRAWKPFVLSFLAALTSLEYMAPVLVLVFFCELLRSKRYKTWKDLRIFILLMVISILYFVSTSFIMTFIRDPEWRGITIHGMALNKLATEPVSILFDYQNKIAYVLLMLAPFAFIPLLRPLYLLPIAPWLGVAFVTNYSAYYSIEYQYCLVVVPFLALSFIDGLKALKISIDYNWLIKVLKVSVIVALVACTIILPRRYLTNPYYAGQFERAQTIYNLLELIPHDASIITQNEIFPHLSSSQNAYSIQFNPFSNPFSPSLSDRKLRWVKTLLREVDADYMIFDLKRMLPRLADLVISEVTSTNDYGVYAFADYVIVFKRDFFKEAVLCQPISLTLNHKNLSLNEGTRLKDESSTSGTVLAHLEEHGAGTFWFGPYAILPLGEYNVTFRLKLGSYADGYIIILDVVDNSSKEILAEREVTSEDLKLGEWTDVTLHFVSDRFRYKVEFRGINISEDVKLYLDYVRVEQVK